MPALDEYPLLERIGCSHDLRGLNEAPLPDPANEMQPYPTDSVAQGGVYFAADSRVFERALALRWLFTAEDNRGGTGDAVNEVLPLRGWSAPVVGTKLPARFLEHGARAELFAECGLDVSGILYALNGQSCQRSQTADLTGTNS